MDPRKNPYAPGAGVMPPEFAGREDLIEAADIALDRRKSGLYANDIILLGLRGVGKTVLLNAIHNQARIKGIETVRFEVPDGSGGHLVRALVPALNVVWSRLDRLRAAGDRLTRAGAALRNFAAIFRVKYEGFSFGATPAGVDAASGDLESDLPELLMLVAASAGARGTCLALFIDELQYLTKKELSALARACHEAAQQGLPMILMAAGLPQIAALAGEAKSYAERLFHYPQVGALDPASARRVLAEPAGRVGVRFEDAALARIVGQTGGYPYFLQTWGKFAWDEAGASPISEADVVRAEQAIIVHLDQNFFRVRFDRCSQAEKRYLRGMAELGPGAHKSGAIAAVLGRKSQAVAPMRQRLIAAGMIHSPGYGDTAFTVPLFDGFMKRAIPRLEPLSERNPGA